MHFKTLNREFVSNYSDQDRTVLGARCRARVTPKYQFSRALIHGLTLLNFKNFGIPVQEKLWATTCDMGQIDSSIYTVWAPPQGGLKQGFQHNCAVLCQVQPIVASYGQTSQILADLCVFQPKSACFRKSDLIAQVSANRSKSSPNVANFSIIQQVSFLKRAAIFKMRGDRIETKNPSRRPYMSQSLTAQFQ